MDAPRRSASAPQALRMALWVLRVLWALCSAPRRSAALRGAPRRSAALRGAPQRSARRSAVLRALHGALGVSGTRMLQEMIFKNWLGSSFVFMFVSLSVQHTAGAPQALRGRSAGAPQVLRALRGAPRRSAALRGAPQRSAALHGRSAALRSAPRRSGRSAALRGAPRRPDAPRRPGRSVVLRRRSARPGCSATLRGAARASAAL
eukprot:gene11468-biopygen193